MSRMEVKIMKLIRPSPVRHLSYNEKETLLNEALKASLKDFVGFNVPRRLITKVAQEIAEELKFACPAWGRHRIDKFKEMYFFKYVFSFGKTIDTFEDVLIQDIDSAPYFIRKPIFSGRETGPKSDVERRAFKLIKSSQHLKEQKIISCSFEEIFKCPERGCCLKYPTYGSMKSHLLTTHGINTSNTETHECDICFKTFASKRNLRRHKQIHERSDSLSHGIRIETHECDICFKTFYHKGNLTRHKKIHEKSASVSRPMRLSFGSHTDASPSESEPESSVASKESPSKSPLKSLCTNCKTKYSARRGNGTTPVTPLRNLKTIPRNEDTPKSTFRRATRAQFELFNSNDNDSSPGTTSSSPGSSSSSSSKSKHSEVKQRNAVVEVSSSDEEEDVKDEVKVVRTDQDHLNELCDLLELAMLQMTVSVYGPEPDALPETFEELNKTVEYVDDDPDGLQGKHLISWLTES